MVEAETRRKIQEFVKEKAAFSGEVEEGQDYYFKVLLGRRPTAGTRSGLKGIYLSKHADLSELQEVVIKHVDRSIDTMGPERGKGDRYFLLFVRKGENNPDDAIDLHIPDDGTSMRDSAAEQIRATQGLDGTFNAAASVALLETNGMLRMLVQRLMEDVRTILEQKTNAEGMITEVLAKLSTAEAMVEVMAQETEIRKVDRMMDRLDPHIQQHGPGVVEAVQSLANGWAWKMQQGGGQVPEKPGAATDWYIDQFGGSMDALGAHIQAHPHTLTPKRRARLEELVAKVIAVAAALEEDDEDVLDAE